MSELTLSSIRCDTLSRETAEKRLQQRRRALLVLVLDYLRSEGYAEAADALVTEAPPGIREHRVCDNTDLDVVFQDYEAYYQLRYGRLPKVTRRDGGGEPNGASGEPRRVKPRTRPRAAALGRAGDPTPAPAPAEFALHGHAAGRGEGEERDETDTAALPGRRRTLQLPPPAGPELQAMAAMVSRDLFLDEPGVRWEHIVGLESAKRVVREAVVYPLRYPRLFAGPLVAPWRALLLFGPPGNGKTLLAKAVASECRTTFFNVSAATLVSKWHGDSEKMVRVLFELARAHAPSTIFLDELDALMGQRGAATEHEASRRLKSELLVQLDGLSAGSHGAAPPAVFVLAASNLPWQLDQALLRRLEKRVLVGLPSERERAAVFERCLADWPLAPGLSFTGAAAATDGYSAADIRLVCREAAMASLRALLRRLEGRAGPAGAADGAQLARSELLTEQDLLTAVSRCRPAGAAHWQRHLHWRETFGAE
ncbi:Katanin p60 ATPase-containing subunit A-like 2 [Amphibalanus amphitrite]|uniref:Katanin p60 ATPase-containing subunit A-like 2 n=1 Tax=Amphibalanus amphitrite TaxID=1232801 RepID=A0A6A4W4T5_AMPAM|nr:katanin p60 ATPase-containing subunit A-like 2 [Amphibalanus amphitrite]KAF0298760.1 Katanin p60 ATPase-containing subunit A-like 2 [Amphibalanus amphitrite]